MDLYELIFSTIFLLITSYFTYKGYQKNKSTFFTKKHVIESAFIIFGLFLTVYLVLKLLGFPA